MTCWRTGIAARPIVRSRLSMGRMQDMWCHRGEAEGVQDDQVWRQGQDVGCHNGRAKGVECGSEEVNMCQHGAQLSAMVNRGLTQSTITLDVLS